MSFSLVPQYAFHSFTDISPGFLAELGVKFLMLDLDNTIAKYSEPIPTDSVVRWISDMKCNSIELFIVSNSRQKSRVEVFANTLGIGFIKRARKPSPHGLLSAMASAGFGADGSAFAGDQIFTDTLAANRAGVISIIVRPLCLKNPFHAIRFAIEAPLRAMCARKGGYGQY